MLDGSVNYRFAEQATHCRNQLKNGSRSFHAAAFLLPVKYREPASALYAFCRVADDLIDGPGDTDAALEELYDRLDSIYRGFPQDHMCDRALARVVRQHHLPKGLLHALLEGFRWDADGRHYADISDVLAYGARVAGSVGVMMALLMGVRDDQMLARAADLGVAMQLTNIARDVGEDASLGRVYLPESWLHEVGLDNDALIRQPQHSEALGEVIYRLLQVAADLYQRADSGLSRLPSGCRPAMYAARKFYSGIGDVISKQGCDSISSRAVVPGSRKLRLALGIPRIFLMTAPHLDHPALPETQFLIDAAREGMVSGALGQLEGDCRSNSVVRVLEIFEELHRRDEESNGLVPAIKRGSAS